MAGPPSFLGRGVLVAPGADAPAGWEDAPRTRIDDDTLTAPAAAIATLHHHWAHRIPVVVEVACDVNALRAAETSSASPYLLRPTFEFEKERLYFLVRANNYDNRVGRMAWGPTLEAVRLGASEHPDADIALDGAPAWIDGGPRGLAVVHRNTLEHGVLAADADGASHAELAPDQLEAVMHAAGPARVIAPAGSGKTRVLTERLRLLVRERQWHPGSITAVAYNVRAKDTMRERLADLPGTMRNRIRTLHSLGNDIVRRSVGNATLIDEWDMRRRIEALVPVKPKANTDMYAPYLEALGQVRLGLVDPQQVENVRDDVDGFAAMFDQYRDRLYRDGALDHDEQIYGAIEVLLRDAGIRAAVQRECRHLLVDEFQDLTPAQLLMLRLVAAPAYDVFGVGDDDQVIYGYAGADPEFLINYDKYFPGGTHHALERNYRCPGAVVGATRNLLSYNRRRIDKNIVAAKDDDADALAMSIGRAAADQLAVVAVERAKQWIGDGAAPSDVAVLARVNAALLPVQLLFDDAGIPCWTPVSIAVLNRTGTRTALAYLRLALAAANGTPFNGPDVATAIRRPSRSIRREILQTYERRKNWTTGQLRDSARGLNSTAADKFELFLHHLRMLGTAIGNGASTAELLQKIRDEVGLGAALTTLDLSGKGPDASHRDDLNALIAVASSQPVPEGFEPWLRTKLRPANEAASNEGVAISTVHRVKGMEWPHVVVLGAHDGSMPHMLADDLEEERRIFHVAITRGDTAVHVVADELAPAPFLDQLLTVAPANWAPPIKAVAALRQPAVPRVEPTGDLLVLVNALKAWRKQRSTADKVPAYVVLSDTHLAGIATAAPDSLEELARCPGIGPTKLERYGDEILAVVSDTASSS